MTETVDPTRIEIATDACLCNPAFEAYLLGL